MKAITVETWEDVRNAVQKGLDSPVYIVLMHDSIEHMGHGDLSRAIVDMAVACESFLRMLLSSSLPSDLSYSIREHLDDVNIRPVLTKFIPDILTQAQLKKLKSIESKLHKLFDTRNDIVHIGHSISLTIEDCKKYLEVTKNLFLLMNS
jgi:hypothetical protein